MATRTSVASGNFSSAGTWDTGVPIDGDDFIIAAGHTVTYDVATPVATGFGNSFIRGILQSQASASTTLRMNGTLEVEGGGTYHARDGHTLQFRGTSSEQHLLFVENEANACIVMEGSDGMPTTTLSSGQSEGATSFTVASAANFAPGEWIAIFNNTTAQTGVAGATTLRDEGFWIHDISGNTIYIRQFVGPESIVVSGENNIIYVANAKIFRQGQKVIFGTGTNRNIRTITSINYGANELTLDGDVVGIVAGVPIYETGSDKIHGASDKVRKCATVTTLASISSSTTITIANANKFTAGDDIWIEARSEVGGSTDYGYTAYGNETPGPRYKHTIASISGNVITLDDVIGYNVVEGALVNRLTRGIVVEPVTPNSDYYGFYLEPLSGYRQGIVLKDVYFKYAGHNISQPMGGIYIREGQFRNNNLGVTLTEQVPSWNQMAWYEGVTMTGSNSTRDWGGFWVRGRYDQLRCCHVQGRFNASYGLYYREGQCLYNSIAVGSDSWGPRLEALTEWGEAAYNYVSRCFRGGRFQIYDTNMGVHHHITDATEYCHHGVSTSSVDFYKFKQTGTRRGPQSDAGLPVTFLYSILRFASGYSQEQTTPVFQGRYQFHSGHIDRSRNQTWFNSLEHNMEYDAMMQMTYLSIRYWDSNEDAWRVYNINDGADYGCGFMQTVFVPAGVTVRTRCLVKLAPSYSGNFPRFEARSTISGVGPNRLGNTGGNWSSWVTGGNTVQQYTALAQDTYQERQLTIGAVNFPRYITIGVHVDNANASEGYWMKDIEIYFDKPYVIPGFGVVNIGQAPITFSGFGIRNTFNQLITRIGGRFN